MVTSALDASVLVLNKMFMAIHVISVRRAFCLLCKELAEVGGCTEPLDLDPRITRSEGHRSEQQGCLPSLFGGLISERYPHAPAGTVSDEPDCVDRFVGRTGCDQDRWLAWSASQGVVPSRGLPDENRLELPQDGALGN